jgi:hypothetical protein
MSEQKDATYSFISHDQQGGVTGIVNVYAPQPEVYAEEIGINEETGSGYVTRIGVGIQSAYAVQTLYVRAAAPSVKSISVHPQHAGMVQFGPSQETPKEHEPGVVYATVMRPDASYLVQVVTERPEQIDFRCEINGMPPRAARAGDTIGAISFFG